MEYLLAGLAGVMVGAVVAAAILLLTLRRRADRDLIERRLRACCEYRDALGNLQSVFETANGDRALVEQGWHNLAQFCREFRTTGWLLDPRVYTQLERLVEARPVESATALRAAVRELDQLVEEVTG